MQQWLQYVPPALRQRWAQQTAARLSREPQARVDAVRRQNEWHAALTREMVRAGVPLLAGTDFQNIENAYMVPGFSLHEELASMMAAGLSPAEALRTATLDPARYLGALDSVGTVAPGKLADLVVLEDNPLVDIRNTQRIAAVVLNGRYLDRAALDTMLARVRTAVSPASR